MTKLTTILFAAATLVLSGCRPVAPSASSTSAPAPTSKAAPIRVALFLDQSASTSWTRTPDISTADLAAFTEVLRKGGGELAFGLVRERSNRGLVRCSIALPPEAPAPIPSSGNPFDLARARAAQKPRQTAYEQQLIEWQQTADAEINRFLKEASPLLSQRNARRTDIGGAVRRARLFLDEPSSTTQERWAIFASDLIDTVHVPADPLPADVRILVANGGMPLPQGMPLFPRFQQLESMKAVVRYFQEQTKSRS
jgi:hypothetical protein